MPVNPQPEQQNNYWANLRAVEIPLAWNPPQLTKLEKPEYELRDRGEWIEVLVKQYEEEEAYLYWEFRTHQAEELAKLLQGWLVKRAHADTG